ncbi:SGNH/GDSL hydrolase family protein [Paraglaciecola aquimarina]|uniref:SGNH/GDSL hydrolase family protein n=1 Tax=Paraglaciecola aquimarina TaxID=1235557 RepID=A0ABU3SYQ1_9ALTE|nr:SGNH/GDSL hydrolase family protein [Paraglaciecola aquimarina]MDU0355133.1 SGNH/GDSL hydrolase family protein [Paraglaciecola aquimarina]
MTKWIILVQRTLVILLLGLTACSHHKTPNFQGPSHSISNNTKGLTKETERIVFIGDSITYSGEFVAYIEAYLRVAYPERDYQFINIGLPSETVSGLSEVGHAGGAFPRPDAKERLQRSLDELKPDLVFSCYGINDGIYLPFAQSRFAAYQNGQQNLHNTVLATGASLIHLTPPDYDKKHEQQYSQVMDTYSNWLISQTNQQGWQVIDLHFPMQQQLTRERKVNPNFYYAKDGIHPNSAGHWQMAKAVLAGLGEPMARTFSETIDRLEPKVDAETLYKLVKQQQSILKDTYLTEIGHTRPRMKVGLPLKQAHEKVKQIEREIQAVLQP